MRGLAVFSVDSSSAQLVWRDSPGGTLDIRCGEERTVTPAEPGPGTALIEGLESATSYRMRVTLDGNTLMDSRVTTLASPHGEVLFRFATISDTHLGREKFGFTGRIRDSGVDTPEERCTLAALAAARRWGSRHLLVKGDLVDVSTPHNWALAAQVLQTAGTPVTLIPGNHEMRADNSVDPRREAARYGLDLISRVDSRDLPGLRLVLMDSTVPGVDIGRWNHLREDAVRAIGHAPGPAMLVVHHHRQPLPFPTHLPRGIPSFAAKRFARAIAAANPDLVATSGHTHRHRRYELEGVPWSEVGSPKDYPGTWAGYTVYEGGLEQTVRKVDDPRCLEWLERTSKAAGGVWAVWSPGSRDQRCFTHHWSN